MLTLQTNFTYQDTEPAPIDRATIVVGFPQYETVDDTATKTVTLAVTGHDEIAFQQKLSSKNYHVTVPTSRLFGDNYGEALIKYLTSLTTQAGGVKISLDDVTIPFSVRFGASDADNPVAFNALYLITQARVSDPRASAAAPADTTAASATPTSAPPSVAAETAAESAAGDDAATRAGSAAPTGSPGSGSSSLVSPPQPVWRIPPDVLERVLATGPASSRETASAQTSSQANSLIDSRIFCVNKQTYVTYLKQLFPNLAPENEAVLLYLLSVITDASGPTPVPSGNPDATKQRYFNSILRFFSVPEDKWASIYSTVTSNFLQFFDFPLKMPKISLLTVAGVLHINAPQKQTLSLADFAFYHLSASFSVTDGDSSQEPVRHISRYDWPATATVTDNSLQFSFKDKYVTSSITGRVDVALTGYDNSELFSVELAPSDPTLQNLNIAVDLRAPPVLTGGGPGGRSSNKKLRGKVVAMAKNCTLKTSVVVQARTTDSGPWTTVTTGESDKTGNFTMAYPYGKYSAAQALVALDSSVITPVKIANPQSETESISTDFIFILINSTSDGSTTKKEDCNCNPTTTAGRLPSQDDLIQSDQYTQDVGGTCMNLSVPNRTLREYRYTALVRNSDPDVANYTLTSQESIDPKTKVRTTSYQLTSKGKITRRRVDLNNPIMWEDAPSAGQNQVLYEAVTVATGHVLHYKSEFRADGYSLGNLLYSLPLAPGQKKEIAIIDSAHAFRGSEVQALSQSERLAADLMSERDIMDQIGGNIGEQMAGSSEASTWGVSAAAGASGGGMGWGANVGVAGGYAKSGSSAQQQSGRNLAGFFHENLRQGVHQNAQSYRQQNSAVVTSSQEAQRYAAETTVVSNHNHCHAITVMHYEVLRHFAIYQELVDVEECVFIPFPLTRFTPENIGRWADVLCTRLLPLHANTYRDPARFYGSGPRHPLAGGFDAVERVRTSWSTVDWPDGRYCDESIIWAQGELTASVNLPRPSTRFDMILSLPIITKSTGSDEAKSMFLGIITGGLSFLAGGSSRRTETEVRVDISNKFMRLDANFQNRRPADCIRIIKFDSITADDSTGFDPADFFHDSQIDKDAWIAYARLLNYPGTLEGVRQMLRLYFEGATLSEWDTIWRSKVAPLIFNRMIDLLGFAGGVGFNDFTIANPYRGGFQVVTLTFSGTANRPRKDIQFLTLRCPVNNAQGLITAGAEFNVRNLRISYSTQHFNGLLYNGAVNNDLLDGVTVYCPMSELEQRYPKADDQWLAQRLITHLNRNLEYYNRVVLYSLDAQRRFMLLDGFHIEVYNRDGTSAGYHSLSSVLKNSPVAMAGNSMVFPVSPGYKVDVSMILKGGEDDEDGGPSLLDFYRPEIPPSPYRISLPSRGVYSEVMMGQCDACEKVKPDSSQDWTKFTTDEPTAIGAIQPPVPEVTQYTPQVKDFSNPMISIQNAPSNPDPGAGLAGITELLGKSGVFKDITGLEGNQQNAMKTYTANMDAARAAAGAATTMAVQSHNTSNSSQIMGTIQSAQDSGLLTKQEAGALVKQHIQNQIDGGQAQKAATEQQKAAAKTSLQDAAVAAVTGNKSVEATTMDGEGNVSTVKISPGGSGGTLSSLAKVTPAVPVVQQKVNTPTCWAAAATMLASWKAGKTLTPEEALKFAGDGYVEMWTKAQGMPASQKDAFIKAMGFASEPPASYPPSKFVDWMKTYGPLWVTTDSAPGSFFSPHAKVLTQIDGDGNDNGGNTTFTWINPTDGSIKQQSFKDFLIGYEEMATDKKGDLYTQIVHLADKVKDPNSPRDNDDPGEGFGIDFPLPGIGVSPVHETLVLSALIQAGLAASTETVKKASAGTHEYIRGVTFNDDPKNYLFEDLTDDNWNYDFFGARTWYFGHFTWPEKHERDEDTDEARKHYWAITERSHYWDLQFLHSMASAAGEDPHDTLAKILLWAQVMYRLATDQGVKPTDRIADVACEQQFNTTVYRLSTFFNDVSEPKGSDTVATLLTGGKTKFTKLDVRRRALGSLFHTLQDSYSKAHLRRTLLNPGDLLPGQTEVFAPGRWAQLGAVENFHTYKGQDHKQHGGHDQWDDGKWGKMDANRADSFNPLWGARMARDRSVELAAFFKRGAPWLEVRDWLMGTVFVFASNISPADGTI